MSSCILYFVHDNRTKEKHLKFKSTQNSINKSNYIGYEYIFWKKFFKNKMLKNKDHNFVVYYCEFSFIIERGKFFLYFPSIHIYASRFVLIRDMSNFCETGNTWRMIIFND